MARDGIKRHQLATSRTTVVEKLETEMLGMLTLMDADGLAYASGILSLDVPEQRKGTLKLLVKYVLRQVSSEDLEGSDDGGSSKYAKLHNHLRVIICTL